LVARATHHDVAVAVDERVEIAGAVDTGATVEVDAAVGEEAATSAGAISTGAARQRPVVGRRAGRIDAHARGEAEPQRDEPSSHGRSPWMENKPELHGTPAVRRDQANSPASSLDAPRFSPDP